jgi:glutamate---cysteine ligase / carboxylate-amine ligase
MRERPVLRGEATGVSGKTEEYTLGVEEEYQIIDPETRALCPAGEGVLRRTWQTLGEEEVVPELRTSQIEALTPVCRTLPEVGGGGFLLWGAGI